MAKVVITGSGSGGAKSDDCTATKNKVLQGYTAVTQDSDDEPITGTMPERGSWNGSVAMNGSVTIPSGHHSGSGKVTGPTVTQRGAWTGKLGINGKITIPEGYHNGQGYVNQSIATQGAQTITPKATSQTVSCNGKYMTGNITVSGDADLVAANIVKGKNIFNVAGSAPECVQLDKVLFDGDIAYTASSWTGDDNEGTIFSREFSQYAYLLLHITNMSNTDLGLDVWYAPGKGASRVIPIKTSNTTDDNVNLRLSRDSNGVMRYKGIRGDVSRTFRTKIKAVIGVNGARLTMWD